MTPAERIRKGDIDASKFCGVCFDEASILRNMKTETTNYVLHHFKKVPYRFVATATPTPNDFIEILNYADYLGVIDRGHALTRFFKRDSTKAGNLTLYDNKKEEFWKWVSTWAVFINKPSDLGYDDTGYDLPELDLREIEVQNLTNDPITNKKGDQLVGQIVGGSVYELVIFGPSASINEWLISFQIDSGLSTGKFAGATGTGVYRMIWESGPGQDIVFDVDDGGLVDPRRFIEQEIFLHLN